MVRQFNTSAKVRSKPPKFLILFAVLIAIGLTVTIVKSIIVKFKTNITINQTLALPDLKLDEEQSSEEENDEWKIVKTQSGDTLGRIFSQLGLSQQTLQSVLRNNPHAKNLANIKPNQELQFLISNHALEKLIFPLNQTQFIMVYRENERYLSKINDRAMEVHNQYVTATVNGSLYTTAKRANIPYKLVQQMVDIFNWEIDFAKEIKSGDQFSIMYKGFFIGDNLVSTGEILAVTYNNRGKLHQAIRYVNADGDYDYFTPQGASLKKAFTRYPLKFSHISSSFSLSRKHPVLHYSRPHKGVDLAAPLGTPIRATGAGRIVVISRQNDYGNMIKISHNKTYTSIYGHLLRFQKGLTRGDFVKRGQIIGYVGQSGLATGPHCHYEFHINQQPKNPTTIELPRASPISSHESAHFKANAGSLLANLKLFEEGTRIAASNHKATQSG